MEKLEMCNSWNKPVERYTHVVVVVMVVVVVVVIVVVVVEVVVVVVVYGQKKLWLCENGSPVPFVTIYKFPLYGYICVNSQWYWL